MLHSTQLGSIKAGCKTNIIFENLSVSYGFNELANSQDVGNGDYP